MGTEVFLEPCCSAVTSIGEVFIEASPFGAGTLPPEADAQDKQGGPCPKVLSPEATHSLNSGPWVISLAAYPQDKEWSKELKGTRIPLSMIIKK